MRIGKILQISLATKCHLLFGLAVISLIVTALLVPWLYMGFMVDELNLSRAKQSALTVCSAYDLQNHPWGDIEDDLDSTWVETARRLGLNPSPPRLIPVQIVGDGEPRPDYGDPFINEAIRQLSAYPESREAHRVAEIPGYDVVMQYAMAIRDADAVEPEGALRGVVAVNMPTRPVWSFANLYELIMIGTGVVACIMAVAVFYLITQYLFLSPVRDLQHVARRIVLGDAQQRADIQTGDEFEELADDFNEMLAHLSASQEELRKMNKSLDSKLGELAEANIGLYEANRLKGEFLANVSHELRTPLTSIIGFAELLSEAGQGTGPVDLDRIRRFSNNILTSGRMLLDIINDLLDLTKIEAGKMTLHRTRFGVTDVCEAVIDFTRPLADKKGLDLRANVPPEDVELHSDRGKLQQIVYNLLSNAIKFTPVGGWIQITVTVEPEETVSISVRDNGPGIEPELHAVIFEKFRQLDGSVTREHSGTGLGLAISRELSVMLGGTLNVHSTPGQGAEFIVRLPMVAPDAPQRITVQL